MKYIGKTENGQNIVAVSDVEWKRIAARKYDDSLHQTIYDYRKSNGLTQLQFAQKIGISRNYLAQIESGKAVNISKRLYDAILGECSK